MPVLRLITIERFPINNISAEEADEHKLPFILLFFYFSDYR
jgi:hypothetical protein